VFESALDPLWIGEAVWLWKEKITAHGPCAVVVANKSVQNSSSTIS